MLSQNSALIWESNTLVSKSTHCFSVSRQRVVFRCDNIQSQLIEHRLLVLYDSSGCLWESRCFDIVYLTAGMQGKLKLQA